MNLSRSDITMLREVRNHAPIMLPAAINRYQGQQSKPSPQTARDATQSWYTLINNGYIARVRPRGGYGLTDKGKQLL